jgi:hypothetical protein
MVTMAERLGGMLERARSELGLSHGELWLRYFALGGMSTAFEVEAILYNALEPSAHDHDVIVQALNERFSEIGEDHPLPYSDNEKDGATDQ